MKEKLQEYALIAEIISAIAIVISLIFVGIQVNQSNNIASAESLRESTQMYLVAYDSFINEESTAFMRKGMNDYNQLSKDEKGRFFNLMIKYISAFDTIHKSYDSGLLLEGTYFSIARGYYAMMSMPGAISLFEDMDTLLPPLFLEMSANPAMTGIDEMDGPWPFLQNE